MRSSLALAVLTLVYETTGASASLLWPFREKRFKAEKLIDAGPLGLEGVQGRVVALGDWNGDQQCVSGALSRRLGGRRPASTFCRDEMNSHWGGWIIGFEFR